MDPRGFFLNLLKIVLGREELLELRLKRVGFRAP